MTLPARALLLLALATGSPAAPAADPLLASAPERILEHRTGPLEITVVDAAGKPVPGTTIEVEQTRHEFLFGCNIFAFGQFGSAEKNQAYQDRFAELFNFATFGLYWASYEPKQGEPGHQRIEAAIDWCREQGITTKGHPLVWNHPAGSPAWLKDMDLDEVRKLSDARVADCVTRFRGRIGIFDVVNEAADPVRPGFETTMTGLIQQVGIEPFTTRAFEIARKANPDATLLINDYRTGPEFEKVIRFLGAGGKPLYDAIGIQSHMHGGAWPADQTWQTCERLAKFGVPLHFTETTIVSGPRADGKWQPTTPELETSQARQIVDFYTLLFSHPAVAAITWWDFSDAHAWQGAAAGLVRRDLSPKPAFSALLGKVKQDWWTRASGKSDAAGRFTTRAFFGQHRVTCTLPDGTKTTAEVALPRANGKASCHLGPEGVRTQ